MTAINISLDGLEETVRALVQAELARLESQAQERWYNAPEAADYLRVNVQRIHDLVSQGRLPRHGGKGYALRFRRGDLNHTSRNALLIAKAVRPHERHRQGDEPEP